MGTGGSQSKNMHDVATATFKPLPDGPYEAPSVSDQPTAQEHFDAIREIKLKDPLLATMPITSYVDHYPPKELPQPRDTLGMPDDNYPFTDRTEYQAKFLGYPGDPRAAPPMDGTFKSAPMITKETTNQHHLKPWETPRDPGKYHTRKAGEAPFLADMDTTYRKHYPPRDVSPRIPAGPAQARPPMPWLNDGTTYRNHYIPQPLLLLPPAEPCQCGAAPFDGTTTYRHDYIPKDLPENLPPLTGILSRDGIQLSLPRRSLGVEYWHKGQTNQYFKLIPREIAAPCRAKQIFTTVNDNQEQACILVLYGDSPVASENLLLGQFDIVNIPPAPKDVPRIEVTFYLDKNLYLTVEARDLDTERHKRWLQRGEIIVLKQ